MRRLHIFRSGTHTAMNGTRLSFSEADLRQIAAGYDPALLEAPLVVGHPRTADPAYGWVGGLRAEGQELYATPRQIAPEFAEAVQSGAYKRVSASFYAPDAPANPRPGQYYLRHVGFLGAMAPAIKGLSPISFAEDEAGVVEFSAGEAVTAISQIFQHIREWIIEKFSREEADKVIPDYEINWIDRAVERTSSFSETESATTPETATAPDSDGTAPANGGQADAQFAERETQIAERESSIKAREAAIAAREQAAAAAEQAERRRSITEFADQLTRQGKIVPRHTGTVAALLEVVADTDQVVEFGEGSTITVSEAVRTMLRELPAIIDYSERSRPADTSDFGESDPKALATAAQAYQAEQAVAGNVVSIVEAVKAVRRSK